MKLRAAIGHYLTLVSAAGLLYCCSSESTDPTSGEQDSETSASTGAPEGSSDGRIDFASLREIAADYAAGVHGVVASELDVGSGTVAELPRAKRVLARFKVGGLHEPKGVDIDVATGRPVSDGDVLVQQEIAAARAEQKKLSRSLRRHLESGDSAPVKVAVWLHSKTDRSVPPSRPTATRGATFKGTNLLNKSLKDRIVETAPARERVLRALRTVDPDARVNSVSPIAYATVPRDYIATLQASSDVMDIDIERADYTPSLNIVKDTLNYAPEVHTNYGYDGTGQKVAVIEWGSDTRVADHSCLDQITQDAGGTAGSHPTLVVGVIACSSTTQTGVAPDAQIWEREVDQQTEVQAAVADALSWGARVTNMSYGAEGTVPEVDDRFVDEQVWTHWITAVVAAGNDGTLTVNHPGLGYNAFTVGNLNDKNTVTRTDDSISGSSCYKDPTSANGDREKPEVAAPGESISTPNTSGGYSSASGTSLAAPVVAGTAALMMEAEPSMQYWPEVVKAAIMASARYNVDGDSRLSDKDGAGGIDVKDAVDIVRPGGPSNSNWYAEGVSCDSAFPRDYTMSLTAGKTVRAVIVWDQDPNYEYYASQPAADLDLDILLPDGSFLTRSNSYDNTYEIVEFTPPTTGTYTARVTKWRCDSTPSGIGFAWFQDP